MESTKGKAKRMGRETRTRRKALEGRKREGKGRAENVK